MLLIAVERDINIQLKMRISIFYHLLSTIASNKKEFSILMRTPPYALFDSRTKEI